MAELKRQASSVRFEHEYPIEMRDGTLLRAEIYRPGKPGRFPVLLVRTPYGESSVRTVPVLPALNAGFAVVVQYCRGTGLSDGEFVTFESEADDGEDTIAWCAAQPWSNGRVGMYGASYLGMVQLQVAVREPEALKAMVAIVTPADYHWGLAYRQGAYQLGQTWAWHLAKSAQQLAYLAGAGEDVTEGMAALREKMADPERAYRRFPLREMHQIPPSWRDWLAHEERDDYWKTLSYRAGRDRIATPALHVGGWFDLFLGGTLDNFVTLSRSAAPQRLIVGPWTHRERTGAAGELHFGAAGSDVAIQLEQVELAFLGQFLHEHAPAVTGPPVKLFVMGDNVWRDENEWPLARTRWTPWYLHGDGSLSPTAPAARKSVTEFTYNPADPAPTVGGAMLMEGGTGGGVSWQPGPRDQRAVEARPDVLSFTSPVLDEDVEVTGPVRMTLYAATSAVDTDFTAKLVNVWPDGRAMGVTDGIVRARFRNGPDRAQPVEPGQPTVYDIDLIATSQVFHAGHRIRVEVSSSNFPAFDRNPNTGSPAESEADFELARQTVFHDASRPSHLVLPIIPRR